MRKRFVFVLLFLALTALIVPQMSRAQAEIQLNTLEIGLWPEFDQESMLVIYKGGLPENLGTVDLTFRIPNVAGRPAAVAIQEVDGALFLVDYGFVTGSEWSEVTFQVPTVNFQLEYYDPRLVRDGSSHTFEYTWPGDYAVNSAAIVVQQPLDASDMQFTPVNVKTTTGEDGLTYYKHPIDVLLKDQNYNFSLGYQKSTDTLTKDKLNVHPAGNKLPESMWNRGLPWALGVLAVLVIAGGVYVYWRSGLPQAGQKKRRRRAAAAAAVGEGATDESGVYCHRCGRRAALSDVFCRSCGTKLRL